MRLMSIRRTQQEVISDLQAHIPEMEDTSQFTLQRMPSKKNLVFDVIFFEKPKDYPIKFVVKAFRTELFETEVEVLNKLINQEMQVPQIIDVFEPYVILEKINGINLTDFINNNLVNIDTLEDLERKIRQQMVLSMSQLAQWMAMLHKKNLVEETDTKEMITLNKGDTRLRDFLIDFETEKLFGFDFEESYVGNHIDDLAWVCCSLLDTDPGILQNQEPKPKMTLINLFLKEYYRHNRKFVFSFNYFAEKLIDYLNMVIERRNLHFGPVRKKQILESISGRFKST